MHSKALIITSKSEKTVGWKERQKYLADFCERVEKYLEDVNVCWTTYSDLRYLVVDGKVSIYDVQNDADVSSYGFVHFKNWEHNAEEAPVIAHYLERCSVPFSNAETKLTAAKGKLAQMVYLNDAGLPVPNTLYARKALLCSMFERNDLPSPFVFPMVLKANDGSRGDDNHLIREPRTALDILSGCDPEKEYVVQNYIPNDGDYRLLYVGSDDKPFVFHRRGADDSHLNNTSKGGSGSIVEHGDLPEEFYSFARKAAAVLGREIGGVDILVDKTTGKPYLLEVNGTPALATGYEIEQKAERFAEYVQSVINRGGAL